MGNIVSTALKVPVRIYKVMISPFIAPRCRFAPTCSAYMIQALERHGPVKGLLLGSARICRCHPWNKNCGHDPVPKRFTFAALFGYKRGADQNNPQPE